MTNKPKSIMRDAFALLSVRLILAQLGLLTGVFGLFVVWLRLPDASVLDLAGSVLLGLIAIAAAGVGEGWLMLGLAGRARTPWRLVRCTLLLLVAAALWLAWSARFDHLAANDYLRAGYLNSRVSHGWRHLFSFEHIALWLGWMRKAVAWIGAGLLAAVVFILTASARPLRAAAMVLRSGSFWLVLLAGTPAAALITGALMNWTPFKGLTTEMLSLVARLAIAAVFDVFIACCLLTVMAVCVRRADSTYGRSAGGPDDSQPRTVEAP